MTMEPKMEHGGGVQKKKNKEKEKEKKYIRSLPEKCPQWGRPNEDPFF